jgi:hypothetical protein
VYLEMRLIDAVCLLHAAFVHVHVLCVLVYYIIYEKGAVLWCIYGQFMYVYAFGGVRHASWDQSFHYSPSPTPSEMMAY